MCGICGYVSNISFDKRILEDMNNSMVHRGPDDAGLIEFSQKNIYYGMAQRRLSIIDLSSLGHQPMTSIDGNIIIIFNGEIYNYLELKEALINKGYKFRSNTDTEVIIVAYQEWGIHCLKKFNGMFVFALYDRNHDELIIARDRIGKKPLYYYHRNNTFIYGSELKVLMQHPFFQKEIRLDIIPRYLYHQYIAAPDTIYKNTYKLEAGSYLVWKNGTLKVNRYWDLIARYNNLSLQLNLDYQEAKSKLHNLLVDSVQKRMISDVPLGAFLSGGIDSSLVTAIAQNNSSTSMKTYSIGFSDPKYDESKYALKIASYLGTNHTQVEINEMDILSLVEGIPHYYDEPFSDASQIPTMLVSRLAKQDVTVALSGDGGDELFCGYNIYDNLPMAQKLDGIGSLLYRIIARMPDKFINRIPQRARAIIMNRDIRTKTQLHYHMTDDITKQLVKGHCKEIQYPIEESFPLSNWQMRRMLLDMQTYLPEDILTKVDRASMRYSLEARCPLLDYRIIEYSFRLPHSYKYNKRIKKYILKDIAYDYIPKELLDRPKMGFGIPIANWLRTSLAGKLQSFSEKHKIDKQGIFEYKVLEKILNNFKHKQNSFDHVIWAYYIFQLWYDYYVGLAE